MKTYRYVKLDPTGNITVLVTDPVPREEQPGLARKLMEAPETQCEQVGFLEVSEDPACRIRLQMMGGEFCGNATMCTAAWVMMNDGTGGETEIPLEVSGAEGLTVCRIRTDGDGWTGTVRMPEVTGCTPIELSWGGKGYPLTAVRMDGITHLILNSRIGSDEEAEAMLKSWAEDCDEDAVGLLQWDEAEQRIRPLVLVKATGTAVWENGCGSGSAAIGAWKALNSPTTVTVTEVNQPGGMIRTEVRTDGKQIMEINISGKVRLIREGSITI